jgi:hypothetical protein
MRRVQGHKGAHDSPAKHAAILSDEHLVGQHKAWMKEHDLVGDRS